MSENWIDLSNVPKYKGTGTKGKYVNDWKNASGCKCDFCCDSITGYFTIKDYDKEHQKLIINYDGIDKPISTSLILTNNIRTLIGLRNKDFKIEIGERFVDEYRNMIVINRELRPDSKGKLRKMYNYHCNVCKWDDGWIDESHLLHGIGCSCCAKTVIVPYVNDVYTTSPEFVKYFKYEADTHETTVCSKKRFMMVCPFCGNEQLYSTEKL